MELQVLTFLMGLAIAYGVGLIVVMVGKAYSIDKRRQEQYKSYREFLKDQEKFNQIGK